MNKLNTPYNKTAVAAAVPAIAALIVTILARFDIYLDIETVAPIVALVTTLLVYYVPNAAPISAPPAEAEPTPHFNEPL